MAALKQNKDQRFQVSGSATDKLLEHLKGKMTGAHQGNSMKTIREIFRQSEERVGQEEGGARGEGPQAEVEGGEPGVRQGEQPRQEAAHGGTQGEGGESGPPGGGGGR